MVDPYPLQPQGAGSAPPAPGGSVPPQTAPLPMHAPAPAHGAHAYTYAFPVPYGYPAGTRHPYADYAVPLYRNAHMAEKRAYHNATERARREVLNTRFQELAQSLPSLSNVRRPSKSVIVNHSLQFVKEIKRKVEIKDRALKSLRARNAQMVGEVNRLRVLLGMGGGPLQIETDEDLEEQEAAAAAALKTDSKNGSSERGSSSSETAKGDAGSASPDTRNLNADTDEDERQQVALAAEQGNMDQLDQRQSESPTGMTLQQGMNPAYNLDHILNEALPTDIYFPTSTTTTTTSQPSYPPTLDTSNLHYTPVGRDSISPLTPTTPQYNYYPAPPQYIPMHPQQPDYPAAQMARRAYSFDASYLPGMQAAMSSMSAENPKYPQQQ